MSKLPQVTAREVVNVLHRIGFEDDRQTGSHLILLHPLIRRRAVVSIHRGDLKPKNAALNPRRRGTHAGTISRAAVARMLPAFGVRAIELVC